MASKLLTAGRMGVAGERHDLAVNSTKEWIIQRVKLFLGGLLNLEREVSHAKACALYALLGTPHRGRSFLSSGPLP